MIEYRTYRSEDFDAVRDLWVRAGLGLRPSDTKEELEKKQRRDPELFIVAEVAGTVVGAAIGSFDGRRGFVYHLAVDPDYQKKGIGRAIMEMIGDRLRELGALRLLLLVDEDNTKAVEFYAHIGMQQNLMHVMSMDLQDPS